MMKMSVENWQLQTSVVCEIEVGRVLTDANLGESGRVETATKAKRCASPQHLPHCHPSHPTRHASRNQETPRTFSPSVPSNSTDLGHDTAMSSLAKAWPPLTPNRTPTKPALDGGSAAL